VVQAYDAFMIAKRMPSLFRRSPLTISITLGVIVILGLVVISPFALEVLAHSRQNWSQLSNIGQTFGAVSALLSSLALVGVVISLLYQARDSRTAHEEASRKFQHDLLKMELDDPSLMNAFGAPYGLSIPNDFIRQFLFIQMWVSYLSGNYAIGESSEANIRQFAANELFRSTAGRSYWKAAGQLQLGLSKGRRNRFFRLLDDEYEKALSRNVPIASPVMTNNSSTTSSITVNASREQARQLGLIAAAAAIGAFAGSI
jgi:Family of unknown function (DUF6082)